MNVSMTMVAQWLANSAKRADGMGYPARRDYWIGVKEMFEEMCRDLAISRTWAMAGIEQCEKVHRLRP